MSPTLRLERLTTDFDLDVVRRPGAPRGAVTYSCALLAVALGIVVALVATGQAWPAPGTVLVLAIPLALCMNRFVFFPNETGVTADAAVIFTAMVACHDGAFWLGPLLVALLAGPLDARHWGERAFVRMAYNSGSTALVTAAALVVFDALVGALGTSWPALLGAAAAAAVPYVAVESAFGVMLVVLLGERPADAVRQQLPLNTIAVPLAVFGTFAGLAALEVGWWAALVVLLPAPLVPELLIVTVPRRFAVRASVVSAQLAAAVVLLALSVVLPTTTSRVVAGLVAAGCLVAAECRATPPAVVSPLVAVLVVVPFVALPSSTAVSVGRIVLAVTAGAIVALVVARARRRAPWLLPFVAMAVCLAAAWTPTDRFGALVFCAGMALGILTGGAWGPLPWASRFAGPTAARWSPQTRRHALFALAFATVAAAVATLAATGTVRTAFACATAALLELAVASAALAVRLWRFVPRRRIVELVAIGVAAAMTLVVYLPLALDGDARALLVAGVALATTVSILVSLERAAPVVIRRARRHPSTTTGQRAPGSSGRRCSGP